MAPQQYPTDVRMPKPLVDTIGIVLRIGKAMVLTVLRSPLQRRFLERGRTEKKQQETHDWRNLERRVGKQAMVADRRCHSRRAEVDKEQRDFRKRDAVVINIE